MTTNILKAIINLVEFKRNDLVGFYNSTIRINQMGDALEYYIKDLFCTSIGNNNKAEKDKEHSRYLSYIGNQNNPPDFIINGSDAVEVKKVESIKTSIALNSSYPKSKMHSDSPMITNACRECEKWEVKDIIYAIGSAPKPNTHIKLLWFLYGDCFAAEKKTYERILKRISGGVNSINGVEFSKTKELGRINKVDPLGITYFRVRGMWGIDNPLKIFDYIIDYDKNRDFTLYSIIKKSKYMSFPSEDIRKLERLVEQEENFKIINIEIKDPNNSAKFIKAKLISFYF